MDLKTTRGIFGIQEFSTTKPERYDDTIVTPGEDKPMRRPFSCLSIVCIVAMFTMLLSAGQQPADEALAKKCGCLECHAIDKKVIGPSYRDIAAKYKDDASARDLLIEKVKKGGKGNWTEVTGGVPMPPFAGRLSTPVIEHLVDWVLSQ